MKLHENMPYNAYYTFEGDEWSKFRGKLSGSQQPGYFTTDSNDERLLSELRAGKTPKDAGVDQALLTSLDEIYDSGVRKIISLADAESDRNPELLKFLWEKNPEAKYLTSIDGIETEIKDYTTPKQEQLEAISGYVVNALEQGENVLVHCGAGSGRTGTALAAIHMVADKQYDDKVSINYIKEKYRESAVENPMQKESLREFSTTAQKMEVRKEVALEGSSVSTLGIALNLDMQEAGRILVNNGAQISEALPYTNADGKDNALKLAISVGTEEDVKKCIEVGANVNIQDAEGKSLFGIAASKGDGKLMETILSADKFAINFIDDKGKSPLMYALDAGDPKIVKQLIVNGADLEAIDKSKLQAKLPEYWQEALTKENLKAVKNLYAKDNSLAQHEIAGQSPIEYARAKENKELFIGMVTLGLSADTNAKQEARGFLEQKPEQVTALILNGVKLSYLHDEEGKLPANCQQYCDSKALKEQLKIAIDNGNIDSVQRLYEFDPSLKSASFSDKSYLSYAAEKNPDLAIKMAKIGFIDAQYAEEKSIDNMLKLAVYLNKTKQVRESLEAGADVAVVNRDGQALSNAIGNRNKEMIDLLISAGADINQPHNNTPPLIAAVKTGDEEIVNLVARPGIKFDAVDGDNKTALICAIDAMSPNIVKNLVQKGANIDQLVVAIQDEYSENKRASDSTVLMYAAQEGKPGIVRILIEECYADLDAIDSQGMTALMKTDNEQVARNLLQGGANPAIKDLEGKTALIHAIEYDYVDAVKAMVQEGINAVNDGKTALTSAIELGAPKVIKMLMKEGASFSDADIKKAKTLKSMQALIEGGVNIDAPIDGHQTTALMKAAQSTNELPAVNNLIQKGANLNAVDDKGQTALMKAIFSPIVDKLLAADNIELDIQDKSGKTALSYALERNKTNIVNALLNKGAKAQDSDLKRTQDIDVMIRLIDNGANVNGHIDEQGRTALMKSEDLDLTIKLLEKGADIHAVDNDGNTALSVVVKNSITIKDSRPELFKEVIKIILQTQPANAFNKIKDSYARVGVDIGMDIAKQQILRENIVLRAGRTIEEDRKVFQRPTVNRTKSTGGIQVR